MKLIKIIPFNRLYHLLQNELKNNVIMNTYLKSHINSEEECAPYKNKKN